MLRKQCLLKTPANWHVNTDIVNQIQDLFTSSQRQKDVSFEKSPLLHFNLREWIRAREIYHEQTRQCPKTNCCNISQNRCRSFKKGYVYQLINTLWLSLVFKRFIWLLYFLLLLHCLFFSDHCSYAIRFNFCTYKFSSNNLAYWN